MLVQTVDFAVTAAEGGHAVEVCATGVLASSGKQAVDPVVSVGASDSEQTERPLEGMVTEHFHLETHLIVTSR